MIPIIIDTDPGMDDILALVAACSSTNLDVRGLTVVAGNTTLENATQNALRLMDFIHKSIPVVKGAEAPLSVPLRTAPHVHGETGLGSVILAPTEREPMQGVSEFICQEASFASGSLELITIGPLTNIAKALTQYPHLREQIRKITAMGGALGRGNVTPYAEFNFYTDPHAVQVVFQSGIPISMVGLDVTSHTYLTKEDVELLAQEDSQVAHLIGQVWRSLKALHSLHSSEEKGPFLHDLMAVAACSQPDLLEWEEHSLFVETEGERRGQIKSGSTSEGSPVQVGVRVDRSRFIDFFLKSVRLYRGDSPPESDEGLLQ